MVFDNCSKLSYYELEIANLIVVVLSVASVLLLMLLLALLVLYRAYKTVLQRLFLYFITATALHNVIITLNVRLRFKVHQDYCRWVGFCNVWVTILLDLLSFSFTVYLIATAYQRFKGKRLQYLGCCRRRPVLTEILFLIIVILLPLTYLWEPAHHHRFGVELIDCWVKSVDKNCTSLEDYKVILTIFDVVYLVLRLTNILLFLALIVIISMLMRQKKVEAVGRAVLLILVISLSTTIIITYFVIDVVKIAVHRGSYFPLYPAVNTSGHIVSNMFIILGIAAYLYSPGKLSIKSLKRAARKWTCCERIRHHCMVRKRRVNTSVTDDNELVSAEISVEQDIPSYTIALTVPYTDGFTDVAGIVSSHRATKYGTVQVKL
jgi:hypothetical protein